MGKYEDCIENFDEFARNNIKELHNNLENGIEQRFNICYDVFRKKFKFLYGKSVKKRFCEICLEVSKEYLANKKFNIDEIAIKLGFLAESNFIRWFKNDKSNSIII